MLRALAASSGRLSVRVAPGAGRNEVRLRDDIVQIHVTAPPADGQANDAVLRLLAAALGQPRSSLRLVRGATSRSKLIAVDLPRNRPSPG